MYYLGIPLDSWRHDWLWSDLKMSESELKEAMKEMERVKHENEDLEYICEPKRFVDPIWYYFVESKSSACYEKKITKIIP